MPILNEIISPLKAYSFSLSVLRITYCDEKMFCYTGDNKVYEKKCIQRQKNKNKNNSEEIPVSSSIGTQDALCK